MHVAPFALTLLAAGGDLQVDLFGEVVVPMNHSARHVDVEVFIGERGPLRFQIDTYASMHACVDDDLARELGLEVIATGLNSDGVTTREVEYVGVDELRLGEATFRNLKVLVDDYSMVPTASGEPLDGLLGFSLFEDLLLTIDYPRERVVLRRGVLDSQAEGVVPFIDRQVPDVQLRIGHRRLPIGIDTGMDATLRLYESDVEDLAVGGDAPVVGMARTVYSQVPIRGDFLTDRVRLAGLAFDANYAIFSKKEDGMRRLCGYGLFGDCVLTFDQHRDLVRFERPALVPFEPEPRWEKRWMGEFQAPAAGLGLRIDRDDDGLVVHFNGCVELRPTPLSETELGFGTSLMRLRLEKDGSQLNVERGPGLVPNWTAPRER